MILAPHLFIGAVIAAKIKFLPLAILLAFLSHYFLDSLPHTEYLIDNIKGKKWKRSKLDFLKLFLDLAGGAILILIVYCLTKVNCFLLFTAAFFAILPDILIVLNWIFPENSLLKKHFGVHQRIHFPKDKKISREEKIATELLVVIIGFLLLLIAV